MPLPFWALTMPPRSASPAARTGYPRMAGPPSAIVPRPLRRTVSLNDQVKVCLTASSSFLTTTSATLTIGTVSGTFTVTTRAQSADLSITKTSAPATPSMGQPLTYTLTVTNAGPDEAEGVTVTDNLAAGLSFLSASAGCGDNSGTVTCDLGNVKVGIGQPEIGGDHRHPDRRGPGEQYGYGLNDRQRSKFVQQPFTD